METSRSFFSRDAIGEAGTNRLLEIERNNGVGVVAASADAEDLTTSVYAWRIADSQEKAGLSRTGAGAGRRAAPMLATLPSYGDVSFAAHQLIVGGAAQSTIDAGHALLLPKIGADGRHAGVVCEYSHASKQTLHDYTVRFAEIGANAPPPRITQLAELATAAAGSTHTLIGVGAGFMCRLSLDPRAPAPPRSPIMLGLQKELDAATPNVRCNYTKLLFTCLATTTSGAIATGDFKGAVRLFSVAGRRATLTFEFDSPVRSIATTPDGAWVVATFDRHVAAIGPFEAPWHQVDHADVAQVVCALSAHARRVAEIEEGAHYVNARIAGYEQGGPASPGARIVVALAHYLVSFPLRKKPKRASATSERAAAAAEARCVYSMARRIVRDRRDGGVAAGAAAATATFAHCDLYDVSGGEGGVGDIVAHAPHAPSRAGQAGASCEMVALSDALIDMVL